MRGRNAHRLPDKGHRDAECAEAYATEAISETFGSREWVRVGFGVRFRRIFLRV